MPFMGIESRVESGPEKERTKAERQPEPGWKLEEEKYFLEVVHIDKDGHEHTESNTEFTPEKHSTTISLDLMEKDIKLEVTPYQMQAFGKDVTIPVENGKTDKLMVGLRDKKSVAWIAIKYTSENGLKAIRQYFFKKDGSPGRCNLGLLHGSSWPTNRPQVVTDEMYEHFVDLAFSLPKEAKRSLIRSLNILSRPA